MHFSHARKPRCVQQNNVFDFCIKPFRLQRLHDTKTQPRRTRSMTRHRRAFGAPQPLGDVLATTPPPPPTSASPLPLHPAGVRPSAASMQRPAISYARIVAPDPAAEVAPRIFIPPVPAALLPGAAQQTQDKKKTFAAAAATAAAAVAQAPAATETKAPSAVATTMDHDTGASVSSCHAASSALQRMPLPVPRSRVSAGSVPSKEVADHSDHHPRCEDPDGTAATATAHSDVPQPSKTSSPAHPPGAAEGHTMDGAAPLPHSPPPPTPQLPAAAEGFVSAATSARATDDEVARFACIGTGLEGANPREATHLSDDALREVLRVAVHTPVAPATEPASPGASQRVSPLLWVFDVASNAAAPAASTPNGTTAGASTPSTDTTPMRAVDTSSTTMHTARDTAAPSEATPAPSWSDDGAATANHDSARTAWLANSEPRSRSSDNEDDDDNKDAASLFWARVGAGTPSPPPCLVWDVSPPATPAPASTATRPPPATPPPPPSPPCAAPSLTVQATFRGRPIHGTVDDPDYLLNIAHAHITGRKNAARSWALALKFARAAAALGHRDAADLAGDLLCSHGGDVDTDLGEALACYLQSASSGSSHGAAMAGRMYMRGRGCVRDVPTGLRWLHVGAAAGNARAVNDLAVHISRTDANTAAVVASLLVTAAKLGDIDAILNVLELHRLCKDVVALPPAARHQLYRMKERAHAVDTSKSPMPAVRGLRLPTVPQAAAALLRAVIANLQ